MARLLEWLDALSAGSSPRRATYFLCFAKESRQRKATPLRVSLRCAAGNLRCSVVGRRCGTRCVLRTSLKHPQRVSLRSACMLRCTRPPHALCSSARAEGSEDPNGPSLRSAHTNTPSPQPSPASGRGSSRPSAATARVVFHPPSGRTEKRSGRGARVQRSMHALRELTRRGCLNGAPQARSEFRGGTPAASIAGCPVAQRRGHAKWGRLSLPTFFGEAKKVGRPPGRIPGQQRLQHHP